MVGIDAVEICRFSDAQNRARFLARVYHPNETCHTKTPQTLAGLFAAKEAVVKAIGCGFCGFWPCDVEIWHDAAGQPRVRLHGAARRVFRRVAHGKGLRRQRIFVSITHTDRVAIAMAAVRG